MYDKVIEDRTQKNVTRRVGTCLRGSLEYACAIFLFKSSSLIPLILLILTSLIKSCTGLLMTNFKFNAIFPICTSNPLKKISKFLTFKKARLPMRISTLQNFNNKNLKILFNKKPKIFEITLNML